MNLLDYLLLALVAAGLWAAVAALRRGKGGCGGGCAGCPRSGQCGREQKPQ